MGAVRVGNLSRSVRSAASFFAMVSSLFGCSGSPPPAVTVQRVVELPAVGQSPLILGRDGGWASRVFDHEVFTFGDTFVTQPDVNGTSFHSNSFSFTDDLVAADGITGLEDRLDAAGLPLPLIPFN